jgi:hypothetical protein
VLQRFFRMNERGTSVGQEVRGGVVTFVTMAYIVVVNASQTHGLLVPKKCSLVRIARSRILSGHHPC